MLFMYSLRNLVTNKTKNNEDSIFCIAYVIILLKSVLAFSELIPYSIHNFNNFVLNALFIGIAAYKIFFFQNYSITQIIVLFVTGIACILSDISLNRFMLIPDFLLLAATQSSNIKKSLNLIWKIEAVIIAIHVIIYAIIYTFSRNILNYTVRGYGNDNRLRHQFLLSHANVFSMLVLWTIFAYIYVNFEKMNNKRIITCWLINLFFYLFTNSNSGMIILTLISIILILRNYYYNTMDKAISFLSKYLFLILALFFNIMMVSYKYTHGVLRDTWKNIDSFFTGRLKYGAYIYDKYGFTLFGRYLSNQIREYWEDFWIDGLPADCMYMFFSVWCGLFFLIVIALLFWKYSDYATIEEKIIIIAYSLYTAMETYVTYVPMCFALLLVVRHAWKDYSQILNNIFLKRRSNEV